MTTEQSPTDPTHTTAPATSPVRAAGGTVWLITGASRGIGRAVAEAALARGDRVVALSRTIASSDLAGREDVLALEVDVSDRLAVFAAVTEAATRWGRIDVVLNNAGTMATGFVEEFSEAEVRAQFETNFFGALWVTQAVAPVLRRQGSGHLIQVSSIGGVGGFPTTGIYSATKFALEGLSEAVTGELAPFDVAVTILEPGGYWTDLYDSATAPEPLPAYADQHAAIEAQFAEDSSDSDPALAAAAILRLADAAEPPSRLLLGSTAYEAALELTEARRASWASWEHVSRAAEDPIPDPRGVRGARVPGD